MFATATPQQGKVTWNANGTAQTYNITSGRPALPQQTTYNITSGCSTTSQADALRFWKEVPDDYKLFTPRDQQRLWGN
jgi:hypothetical protein